MRVLFACERSAGHIFPALAIAKRLKRDSDFQSDREPLKVYFFITSSFLKEYVKREGFYVTGKNFVFRTLVLESIWRFFEAIYLIIKLRPQRIIGFGGRDSFFLILLSVFFNIDTAIYELNLSLGKTNKLLSFFANKVLQGFEDTSVSKKARVVGIPLRENIKKLDRHSARAILDFDAKPVIFCFGGSQGSQFINQVFIHFVQSVKGEYQIIHLTGRNKYFEIIQIYNKIKNKKFIKDFYYPIEILYSAADIVVSRAGALTLAEISYYGLPSILIPHPGSSGHQRENALYFKERGAAFVYLQSDFSFKNFSQSLQRLLYEDSLRQAMIKNVGKIKLGVGFEDFSLTHYR